MTEELDALIARLRGLRRRSADQAADALEALRDELREARHERDGFHAERDLAREDVARLRKLGDGMAERAETLRDAACTGSDFDITHAAAQMNDALAAWNLEALR